MPAKANHAKQMLPGNHPKRAKSARSQKSITFLVDSITVEILLSGCLFLAWVCHVVPSGVSDDLPLRACWSDCCCSTVMPHIRCAMLAGLTGAYLQGGRVCLGPTCLTALRLLSAASGCLPCGPMLGTVGTGGSQVPAVLLQDAPLLVCLDIRQYVVDVALRRRMLMCAVPGRWETAPMLGSSNGWLMVSSSDFDTTVSPAIGNFYISCLLASLSKIDHQIAYSCFGGFSTALSRSDHVDSTMNDSIGAVNSQPGSLFVTTS